MKYINQFSKQGFVNLFADFIVQNINPIYKTRIQVVDFKSFLVVCGSTSSGEIIDLNKLRDEFTEKNQTLINYLKLKHINIIDLIEYKEPLPQNELYFEYYNSSRPIYHQRLINEIVNEREKNYNFEFLNSVNYDTKIKLEFYSPFMSEESNIFSSTNFLSISSTYPHGHSLNVTRTEFYYGEYLCNHLFDLLQTDKIIFKYSSIQRSEDTNITLITNSMYSDEDVKSLVLDTFDFNFEGFKSDYLLDYNLSLDTTNPLDKKPWLIKNKIKDMILI